MAWSTCGILPQAKPALSDLGELEIDGVIPRKEERMRRWKNRQTAAVVFGKNRAVSHRDRPRISGRRHPDELIAQVFPADHLEITFQHSIVDIGDPFFF